MGKKRNQRGGHSKRNICLLLTWFVVGVIVFGFNSFFFDLSSSSSSSSSPNKAANKNNTAKKRLENKGNPFSIVVYQGNDVVSKHIREQGIWEMHLIQILNNHFLEFSQRTKIPLSELTFIDIGANVGWFTMNMGALGVNVIAFEPMADNIALIEKSLSLSENVQSGLSGRVTLHRHGLGTKEETCYLISDNSNVGDGNVKCVEKEEDLHLGPTYQIRGKIPIHRLDNVIDLSKIKNIVAIKMDVEGFEDNVLVGGPNVFENGGAELLLTEFQGENMIAKGGNHIHFVETLAGYGYRILDKPKGIIGPGPRNYMTNSEMVLKAGNGELKKLWDLVWHSKKYTEET